MDSLKVSSGKYSTYIELIVVKEGHPSKLNNQALRLTLNMDTTKLDVIRTIHLNSLLKVEKYSVRAEDSKICPSKVWGGRGSTLLCIWW